MSTLKVTIILMFATLFSFVATQTLIADNTKPAAPAKEVQAAKPPKKQPAKPKKSVEEKKRLAEEKRKAAEAAAKRLAEQKRQEELAKKQAAEKKKADELRKKQEAEAKRAAEAKRKADEARKAAEAKKKAEEEKRRKAEAEKRRKAEAERRRRAAQAAAARREAYLERLRKAERTRKKSQYEKNYSVVRAAWRPVIKNAAKSTVRVLAGGRHVSMGTIISPNGFVLTKASELREGIEIKLQSGPRLKAKIAAVSEKHDLALLKMEVNDLTPVQFSSAIPSVGSFLATPGIGEDPVAVGVVSVAARSLQARGFLGIGFAANSTEPKIGQIFPRSAAASAGIKVNDVITRINGSEVKSPSKVIDLLRSRLPGDKIAIHLKRAGKEVKVDAVLGKRQMDPARRARFDRQNMLGGELSDRREDFPTVMQHDTILFPEQCGGPVVDLSGRTVGINIARAGRVNSYAVPAKTVVAVLKDMKAGKFPVTDSFKRSFKLASINDKVKSIDVELKKAEQQKAAIDRAINKHKSEIDKLKKQADALKKAAKK